MIPRDASFCERRTTQRRAVWVARHGLRIGSALLACPEQLARTSAMASRHLPFAILLSLLVVISPCRSHAGSERTTFFLSNEFFGPMGYSYPEVAWNFQNGMTNMLALWPPADAGMFNVIASRNTGFNFYMQGASHVVGPTGLVNSAPEIASQSQSASTICTATGKDKSLWSLMLEWDQSGGKWVPNGRPRYLD